LGLKNSFHGFWKDSNEQVKHHNAHEKYWKCKDNPLSCIVYIIIRNTFWTSKITERSIWKILELSTKIVAVLIWVPPTRRI
jgi:hypothetical protein